jgi:hypothetical protein
MILMSAAMAEPQQKNIVAAITASFMFVSLFGWDTVPDPIAKRIKKTTRIFTPLGGMFA